MKILKKVQEARDLIKKSKVKKVGYNTYGKYYYFTPEQINEMVHDAESKTGLAHFFSLLEDEFGYYGKMTIVDMKDFSVHDFTQRTAIPQITATNASQQIGGAVTFTQRYMLMSIYDIADNSLDFDDDANSPMKSGNKTHEKKPTSNTNKKTPVKQREKKSNSTSDKKGTDIPKKEEIADMVNKINMCTDIELLKSLWMNEGTDRFKKIQDVVKAKNTRKKLLEDE